MFPLPRVNVLHQYNGKTFRYKAEECKMLIFRSNLSHMVNYNNSDDDRISISMNFIVE